MNRDHTQGSTKDNDFAAGAGPAAGDITRLLKQLISPWPYKRKLIAEEVAVCGEAAITPIAHLWNELRDRSARYQKRLFVNVLQPMGYAAVTLIILASIHHPSIPSLHTHSPHSGLTHFAGYAILIAVHLTSAACIYSVLHVEAQRERLAIVATRLCDKRLLNLLAYRLEHSWPRSGLSEREEHSCLAKLLLELQPADSNLVDAESRRILVHWLGKNVYETPALPGDAELVSAIMIGLSTIGAAKLRPVVQSLANMKTSAPHRLRIKDEAARALERLDAWSKRDRSGEILVRGSSPPGVEADVLVRAASASQEPDDQLLRPEGNAVRTTGLSSFMEETVLARNGHSD